MGGEMETDKELTEAKTPSSRASRIETLLMTQFSPVEITLEDESHRHAGHAGANPEGQSHYRLRMVADAFDGLNRVARQRLVLKALDAEFASGLHALALDLKTPAEAAKA